MSINNVNNINNSAVALTLQNNNVHENARAEASKTAAQTSKAASTKATVTEADDGFAKNTIQATDSTTYTTYTRDTASKGLSKDEIKKLTEQQTAAYSNMINNMLTNQKIFSTKNASGQTLGDIIGSISTSNTSNLKDILSTFNVSEADSVQAASAIGENGDWGVDAVATRIMDMAQALSGGDSSKFETLKEATLKGFGQAAKRWGVKDVNEMPSITQKTYNEVVKRFDYLEQNGTMEGYVYGKTNVAEGDD